MVQPIDFAALAPLQDRHFLVVDDEDVNLQFFINLFEDLELPLDVASDGRQAVERVFAHPPGYYAAVLMDIRMPELNGAAATEQIKAHNDWADLPIIAMSGNAQAQDRDFYLQAGMVDLLPKPADLQSIIAVLLKWAVPGACASSTSAEAPYQAHSSVPLTGVDIDRRLRETGLTMESFCLLLQAFQSTLETNQTGLRDANDNGDLIAAADAAHKLAGACGNIGAYPLRESLKTLQKLYEDRQPVAAQQALTPLNAQLHQLARDLERFLND